MHTSRLLSHLNLMGLAVLLLLGSAGCASPTVQPTLTPVPTATQVPTLPPPTPSPTPAEPTPLTINASDNALIAANYYPPIVSPAPAVLLLHMYDGSKADWDAFARTLQTQGYAALAIDLRGFGESAKPEDWTKAPEDVRAAWQVLTARPEVDANHTAVVGASIGANLALLVGGTESRIAAVVALSPGLDFYDLKPAEAMAGLAQRPAYLVASKNDPYSAISVQNFAQLSSSAETLLFESAGHGTEMFKDVTLSPKLVDWLNKALRNLKD